jgi:hypothetical protein
MILLSFVTEADTQISGHASFSPRFVLHTRRTDWTACRPAGVGGDYSSTALSLQPSKDVCFVYRYTSATEALENLQLWFRAKRWPGVGALGKRLMMLSLPRSPLAAGKHWPSVRRLLCSHRLRYWLTVDESLDQDRVRHDSYGVLGQCDLFPGRDYAVCGVLKSAPVAAAGRGAGRSESGAVTHATAPSGALASSFYA